MLDEYTRNGIRPFYIEIQLKSLQQPVNIAY